MEIFGVGIGEFVFILIIAIIVLGPDGMVKAAHTLGVSIRKLIHSPIWSMMMNTQREIREIPTRLVREAGLEEDLKEIQKTSQEVRSFNLDHYTKDLLKVPPDTGQPAQTIKPPEADQSTETIEPPETGQPVQAIKSPETEQTAVTSQPPETEQPAQMSNPPEPFSEKQTGRGNGDSNTETPDRQDQETNK
jgi:hypothetical protein